jgi:Ca2+-dependent lipid-binding protein
VIEGKELRAMDIGGKSDPFVVVSCGPFTFRSPIVKNTLNPVWNAVCSSQRVGSLD